MTIEELESAVRRLSPEELSAFSRWFQEFHADAWDRQIEQDALADGEKVPGTVYS